KQKLDYARAVRDGKIHDPGFLPVIFEHPDDMVADGSALKLENMWMTNPNMGFSVDQDFLEREYRKAEMAGGESFRGFMAKHANVEIGMNLRSDRWAGSEFWEAQAKAPGLTLQELLERSEVVDVGIDGGGLDDLLGLAVIGRERETRKWLLWTHAWAHPSVFERRKEIAPRLHDFARDGDLTLSGRMGDDVAEVAEICELIESRGLLDKIGCDPAGLGGITDALHEAGIPPEKMIGISQGWKLHGAILTAERKLAEGVLVHSGQPLMAWCVGNAKVEPRGNAVMITKQAAGTGKIDPLMATFDAATLMALNPEGSGDLQGFFDNPIMVGI
ncbi:MAG: terminase TerL endonuclease subunit, partial [Acidovorax sp.]|nr:terminase TerL endonuclease subunit [Acidovorax sp.]